MEDVLNEGVEVQEAAEPVVTDNNDPAEGQEPQDNGRTEEDTRFANVRRKAEEDARMKYETRQNQLNDEVKRLFGGYAHPTTGMPIESMEQYLEAVAIQQRMQQEEALKEKGVDPELINTMINNSPVIRQANQILQDNLKNDALNRLKADLQIVSEIDPSIQSESDLAKHESYEQVVELVSKHGLSLPEAFKLANYDSISAKRTSAVKQAAINQARGKDHLEGSTSGVAVSESGVDIPLSEIATWREYYPGLSDAELKKKYNRTL